MCVSQGLKTYNGYSFGFVRGISLEKINYFLISRRLNTVWKIKILREINFDEVSESAALNTKFPNSKLRNCQNQFHEKFRDW